MREIKYRLIEKGKIVGYERHILIDGTISIQHQKINESIWRFIYPDYKDWICHDHKEPFLDLKDKNGKEIYEGDIVKHIYYYSPEMCSDRYKEEETIEVKIPEFYEFIGKLKEFAPSEEKYLDKGQFLEVIGNIHENPELLK